VGFEREMGSGRSTAEPCWHSTVIKPAIPAATVKPSVTTPTADETEVMTYLVLHAERIS